MQIYTRKFLGGGYADPKIIFDSLRRDPPAKAAKTNFFKHNSKTSKYRIKALQEIILSEITDIMTNGDMAKKLECKKIQITKVRVVEDLMGIHVYYQSLGPAMPKGRRRLLNARSMEPSGNLDDYSTEDLLAWAAPLVRKELCEKAVLTVVPPLSFRRDMELLNTEEVQTLLVATGREVRDWEASQDPGLGAPGPQEPAAAPRCVLHRDARHTVLADMDIFSENFSLELCAAPVEAWPGEAGTALRETDVYGDNPARMLFQVEKVVRQYAEDAGDRHPMDDLSVPVFSDDDSRRQEVLDYPHKSAFVKWSQVYAKRLKENSRAEHRRMRAMEDVVIHGEDDEDDWAEEPKWDKDE